MNEPVTKHTTGYTAAPNQVNALTSPRLAPRSEALSGQDFGRMLSVMLLGSSVAGMNGAQGDGGAAMMAPLMALLMEQLLSGQLAQDASGDAQAPANTFAGAGYDPEVGGGIMPGYPIPYGMGETAAGGSHIPSGMPVSGGRLTQGSRPGHVALDFGVPVGTPVRTTMNGQVVFAGWNNEGYGNLVIVENGPYRTYYAHLSSMPVSVGQTVPAGSVIGLSGNTGNSTGPHLHYEIRVNKEKIDPTNSTLRPDQSPGFPV
jgi:murein DD-endopeptidase MepM/ murein hydrolase activator NlpD